jgi:hypothetical protein
VPDRRGADQQAKVSDVIEIDTAGYADRVAAIRSRVLELARQAACAQLSIEIDAAAPAPLRSSHTVTLRADVGEEALALTEEEFWGEYDLFEHSAAPRLRAAIERLTSLVRVRRPC